MGWGARGAGGADAPAETAPMRRYGRWGPRTPAALGVVWGRVGAPLRRLPGVCRCLPRLSRLQNSYSVVVVSVRAAERDARCDVAARERTPGRRPYSLTSLRWSGRCRAGGE